MKFSNLYDDISSMMEGSLERSVCGNKSQNYDVGDDNDHDHDHDHDGKYKSKNLLAERKRREKLKSRMLQLRSIVPNITNLNKETIITDAIDYIEELLISVENLTNEIHEMEAEMANEPSFEIIQTRPEEKMVFFGIKSEVVVTRIDDNKLWVKLVLEKKLGGFTKLVEAMSILGIEFVDTSVTTMKGAVLVTSCVEGTHGKILVAEQIQKILLDIIKVI